MSSTMIINLIEKNAQITCTKIQVGNFQTGTELWLLALGFKSTIHQGLINHKQLSDPFYDINKQKIQWVENEDWEYRTAFTVTPEQLKRDDAQLVFEGLDT